MLIANENYLALPSKVAIKQLTMSYENTFVLLIDNHNEQRDNGVQHISSKVLHLDKHGTEIHEYDLNCKVDCFLMINLDEILLPLVDKSMLVSINLKKNYHFIGPWYFLQMFFFSDSNMICIKQSQDGFNDRRFQINFQKQKLTYFSANNLSEPLITYQNHSNSNNFSAIQLRCSVQVNQVNNHSMIGFFLFDISQVIIHNIVINQTVVKSRVRMVPIPLSKQVNFRKLKVWEIQKNQLLYVHSNISGNKGMGVVNIKSKMAQKIVWKHENIRTRGNVLFLKDFICIQEPNHQYKQTNQNSMVSNRWYIIERQSLKSSATSLNNSCKFSNRLNIYNSEDTIIDINQDNSSENVQILLLKPFRMAQVYMQLLLAINEDFDEDLLMDTIQCLERLL